MVGPQQTTIFEGAGAYMGLYYTVKIEEWPLTQNLK